MKTCTRCSELKPLGEFYKKLDQLTSACKDCIKKARQAYYRANPKKVRATNNAWRYANIERTYDMHRRLYPRYREKKAATAKVYYEANKLDFHERSAMRRAIQRHAFPKWADRRVIAEAYAFREREEKRLGIKLHVDHVIPLAGKDVCGFHVEWNLRVTRASSNWSKNNRYSQDEAISATGTWESVIE